MLSYNKLKEKPKMLRAFTGLDKGEFLQAFEKVMRLYR